MVIKGVESPHEPAPATPWTRPSAASSRDSFAALPARDRRASSVSQVSLRPSKPWNELRTMQFHPTAGRRRSRSYSPWRIETVVGVGLGKRDFLKERSDGVVGHWRATRFDVNDGSTRARPTLAIENEEFSRAQGERGLTRVEEGSRSSGKPAPRRARRARSGTPCMYSPSKHRYICFNIVKRCSRRAERGPCRARRGP